MPVCEYCQKDEESHMCPEFVNNLRRERDAAVRALEIIAGLGPVDPATNAAKIGIDAMGVAVTALNKRKQRFLDCVCGRPAFEHGGCRNYRPKKPCPSTYTHSSLGKLECEKDEAHLHRIGDVQHKNGQQIWMSI